MRLRPNHQPERHSTVRLRHVGRQATCVHVSQSALLIARATAGDPDVGDYAHRLLLHADGK